MGEQAAHLHSLGETDTQEAGGQARSHTPIPFLTQQFKSMLHVHFLASEMPSSEDCPLKSIQETPGP